MYVSIYLYVEKGHVGYLQFKDMVILLKQRHYQRLQSLPDATLCKVRLYQCVSDAMHAV